MISISKPPVIRQNQRSIFLNVDGVDVEDTGAAAVTIGGIELGMMALLSQRDALWRKVCIVSTAGEYFYGNFWIILPSRLRLRRAQNLGAYAKPDSNRLIDLVQDVNILVIGIF